MGLTAQRDRANPAAMPQCIVAMPFELKAEISSDIVRQVEYWFSQIGPQILVDCQARGSRLPAVHSSHTGSQATGTFVDEVRTRDQLTQHRRAVDTACSR
jgi:hypothetical protein